MEINNSFVQSSLIKNSEVLKDEDLALKKASDDFESFFMQQLMNISLKSSSIAGEGSGSDIIKGMYIESIASNSNGSLGISEILYDFLSKNNKK